MSRYVLGRDAERDLDHLWESLAGESVEAAYHLIKRLFGAFEALARNPGMGHTRQDLTALPVLFWPVGNYLVIYRVQKPLIQIVAVVYGKRDSPAFLRQRDDK